MGGRVSRAAASRLFLRTGWLGVRQPARIRSLSAARLRIRSMPSLLGANDTIEADLGARQLAAGRTLGAEAWRLARVYS